MKHKIMQAMQERDDNQPLQPIIQLDEVYMGAELTGGKHCREPENRTNEFFNLGLSFLTVRQVNISLNLKKGTLRGLHDHLPPAIEAKLIRCTKVAIYDVIVDLRPESPSFLKQFGLDLSATNSTALYIPEIFAHGYQILADNTEVSYQVSESCTPNTEQGIRFDDPRLGIKWPMQIQSLSKKDESWGFL